MSKKRKGGDDFEYDFSWVDEGVKRVDAKTATYDPAKGPLLEFRWPGIYRFRLLPVFSADEYDKWTGIHWGVLPPDGENGSMPIPCPAVNSNQLCPICDFLSEAMGKGLLDRNDPLWKGDNQGQGSIRVKKFQLLRVLFLGFKAEDPKRDPDFGELPALRIARIPKAVAGKLNRMMSDKEDFGPDTLMNLDTGYTIRVQASPSLQFYWEVGAVPSKHPIPAKFRNREEWDALDPDEHIPQITTDAVLQILEKHQDVIDERLVKQALSIDVSPKRLDLVKPVRTPPAKPVLLSDSEEQPPWDEEDYGDMSEEEDWEKMLDED